MLPNRQRGSVVRLVLMAGALAIAVVFVLVSLGRRPQVRQAAARRLDAAEAQRESAATRAAVVVARAAEARAAVRPVLARRAGRAAGAARRR